MDKVLLPHVPSRVDPLTHARIPIVNLDAAANFGPLVTLLPLEVVLTPESIPGAIRELHEMLDDNYEDGDWLLCIGDPIIQMAAAHWIVSRTERLRVLRWDGLRKAYDPVEIEMAGGRAVRAL